MSIEFAPEEVDFDSPTRAARLKWVIVVDDSVPAGPAFNAVACIAAATGSAIAGLLGDDATEPDGGMLPGLPWAGCSVLTADAERLDALRTRARSSEVVYTAQMPEAAQTTRVYREYLDTVARGEGTRPLAVSVVGPRNRIDKLTKGLPLLA